LAQGVKPVVWPCLTQALVCASLSNVMGNSSGKKSNTVQGVKATGLPPMSAAAAEAKGLPQPGQRWRGVKVVQAYPLGKDAKGALFISAGSIIDFEGDAIVNAANEGCITGGGVDGAVTSSGGDALAEARRNLPVLEGTRNVRCRTGDAVITIGGDLKAQYCIHAVGPNYGVMLYSSKGVSIEDCDALVSNAYVQSLKRAQEKALRTVGFSLLSSGIFRGPQSLEKILEAGVLGVLQGAYPELEEVHLIAFTRAELQSLQDVCASLFREGTSSPSSPASAAPSSPARPAADAATASPKAQPDTAGPATGAATSPSAGAPVEPTAP